MDIFEILYIVEDISYSISEVLTIYPIISILVALLFLSPCVLSSFSKGLKIMCGISGGVWLLYAIYEFSIFIYGKTDGVYPIRNDMLLIGPILLILAVVGMISIIRGVRNAT